MLYLDQAATSHPKPPQVVEAMQSYMALGGNPGRSGHAMATAAEETIWQARESAAELFGAADASRVVFTLNATMALNMVIKGLPRRGARVLTSGFEHNSVARPVHALASEGISWTIISGDSDNPVDLNQMEAELAQGDVHLVVVAHGSNVTGAVAPLEEISSLCSHYGAFLLVDAAQTAGHIPLRVGATDLIVFSGHKGLLGPQGVGGLVLGSESPSIEALITGGTGGRSELMEHPRWLPNALEAGTPNGVGIAGLAAGIAHVKAVGFDAISGQERSIREAFVSKLEAADRDLCYRWPSSARPMPVVSVRIPGLRSGEAAALLEERYQILVRGGLHCSPLAHRSLGTLGDGTVRVSFSHQNTPAEAQQVADAILELVCEHEKKGHY
ncbi:aminotransferase class V-fold PLP-dependent enzyme [Nonomuraea sp. B19D2]|uniref:aminotransferase class V-fold PLP-dependent enzyme n=1 Tax=Nonomuraea sp. B19D2 TaxID=3159561 RepID=UPI0032DAB861